MSFFKRKKHKHEWSLFSIEFLISIIIVAFLIFGLLSILNRSNNDAVELNAVTKAYLEDNTVKSEPARGGTSTVVTKQKSPLQKQIDMYEQKNEALMQIILLIPDDNTWPEFGKEPETISKAELEEFIGTEPYKCEDTTADSPLKGAVESATFNSGYICEYKLIIDGLGTYYFKANYKPHEPHILHSKFIYPWEQTFIN